MNSTNLIQSRFVILAACLLLCAGCSGNSSSGKGGTGKKGKSESSKTKSSEPTTGQFGVIPAASARKIGGFDFVDQFEKPFTDENLKSKLTVVNFIFTTCPGTCLKQAESMRTLQDRFKKVESSDAVNLISITVNPEVDTPETLRQYAKEYGANPKVWHMLTGDKKKIWAFANDILGMSVTATPEDPLIPIAHESKFALLDRSGRLRGYYEAIDEKEFENLWSAIDVILPEFTPEQNLLTTHGLPDDLGHLAQPGLILDHDWLDGMAVAEAETLKSHGVSVDFKFTESRSETGITFNPQIVDDQRHRLLVNHYDHGNSISVADVDNDGHLDVYFVSQVGPNELWRSRGDGTFENITESAGVGMADRISVAGSFCDVDNDGDQDLFVTSIRDSNMFFENDGKGHFKDITTDAGLEYSGHSSRGTFFDYDRDGLADLFVSNVGKFTGEEKHPVRKDICNSQKQTDIEYYVGRPDAFLGHLADELIESSILYRNLGNNRFKNVTKSVGLANDPSWSGEAIVFDANHDQWPDVYVCNMQGHDRLYINSEGKKFEDKTNDYFKATPWGTMGAAVFDYDNNGLLDLFLTDMHSDMSKDIGPEKEKEKAEITWSEEILRSEGRSIFGNAFFSQTKEGTFEEISDTINAENYWPWGLSYGDFNADGLQDAFVCSSMCFPYRYGINSLLLNHEGKRFVDAHFATGIEPRADSEMIAPWFELDFSGKDKDSKLAQGRQGKHVVWSVTGTRSCAVFDYDEDGDLDIMTNEFNTPPQIFKSNLAENDSCHFVKVKLQGTTSTRDGLGSVVVVETKAGAQRQVYNGTTGYLSQSAMPLYFGLGGQSAIEKVTVIWPDGQQQTVETPKANQLLTIEQEKAE